ncbi:MAG: thiamine phosphate synthase [Bacteroidales bacterium]
MKLIIITTPNTYPQEAEAINQLLKAGAGTIHLRKPEWSEQMTNDFIQQIDSQYHNRIVIHDHYQLSERFDLKGIHLNQRNANAKITNIEKVNSNSLHSIEELEQTEKHYKYHLLSPVYESISKLGYTPSITKQQIKTAQERGIINQSTIALGGVSKENIQELDRLGFGGVALLGSLWSEWCKDFNTGKLIDTYLEMQQLCNAIKRKRVSRLHYITKPNKMEPQELLSSSSDYPSMGLPLMQLRNKHASQETKIQVAKELRTICKENNTTLIINDDPLIALKSSADGVHLGKSDMPIEQARQILGYNFIIGGTANSFEDIQRLTNSGVDYIGLGPFRFTTTKDNLSPILGLDGYKEIVARCKEKSIDTPIIAIGGILPEDIPSILECGVDGIAISSSLTLNTNLESERQEKINLIKTIKQQLQKI